MSKAFDLALHSKMFEKMLEANLEPIFIRLLIFIYRNQEANVLGILVRNQQNFQFQMKRVKDGF